MVLFIHHLADNPCSRLMLGNLLNRILRFYELKNIKVLEVRVDAVSLQSGGEKDYMHDLLTHQYVRWWSYIHWKYGEQEMTVTEKL